MKRKVKVKFTSNTTKKIAALSKLKIDSEESKYLTKQFNETLVVVERFERINTKNIDETSHVTGLKNILREDKIEKEKVLTQSEALSNSKRKYEGFFVVDPVFENE